MHEFRMAIVTRQGKTHFVIVRWKVGDVWEGDVLAEMRGRLQGDRQRQPDDDPIPVTLTCDEAYDLMLEVESRQYDLWLSTFCLARSRMGAGAQGCQD